MIDTFLLLAGLWTAAPDSGAAFPDTARVVPVRGVEVTGARPAGEARRTAPTGFASEHRAGETGRAVERLDDLLALDPATVITRYGGLGSFTTVSLRGASPGHVAVVMDGVPLQSAANGIADLAAVPMAALAGADVQRSFTPPALGAPLPGGAVVLHVRDDARLAEARVAHGSFGTTEARGAFARPFGPVSALAIASLTGATGDYRFLDDNGTPQNADDDSTVNRSNNRLDAWSGLLRLAGAGGAWRASLRGEAQHQARCVPGLGSVQTQHPRFAAEREALVGELGRAAGRWTPGASLRGTLARTRTRFRDPEGELGLGRQVTDQHTRLDALTLGLSSPARTWLALDAGAEWRAERAEAAPYTLGAAPPPVSTRGTRAAWASLQLSDPGDRLRVHAARRWDEQFDHLRASAVAGTEVRRDGQRTLDSPQVGVRVRLPRGAELRANHARTSRAPDFTELFGEGGSVQANPALAPEASERWDLGLAASGRARGVAWSCEGAHFENALRRMIVFQRSGPSSVRARNVGHAALRGEEAMVRLAWRGVAWTGSASWLSALDTTDPSIYHGRRLPQRVEREWGTRLALRAGTLRGTAEAQWLGDAFLDPANLLRQPARSFVSASLGVSAAGLEWTLEGRNLGGTRTSDVPGYPLPGRSVFAAVGYRSAPSRPGEP